MDKLNEWQLAEACADSVNSSRFKESIFVTAMANQHRTLQQGFTAVCLAWLDHLAGLEPHQYDLRNEAAVQAARKCRAALGPYGHHLPTV